MLPRPCSVFVAVLGVSIRGLRPHCFGAHRSYSSLSAGSKHVTSEGSDRITTLRAGVANVEAGATGMGRYSERDGSRMRERFEMVDDVGEASPPCRTAVQRASWLGIVQHKPRCCPGLGSYGHGGLCLE